MSGENMSGDGRGSDRKIRGRLIVWIAIIGLVAGFGLSVTGVMPVANVQVEWYIPALKDPKYVPESSQEAGGEIILVYVGSSRCGWSNTPELPDLVDRAKRNVARQAAEMGMRFAAVGISRDVSAERGLRYLARFGRFDEVMSGRGWANIGVQKYIYGEMPGLGATPQIIVVSRGLNYDLTGHVTIVNESVLTRRVGLEEISEWAFEGANIDVVREVASRTGRATTALMRSADISRSWNSGGATHTDLETAQFRKQ